LHIQGRLAGVVALLRKKVGMFNPDDLDHLVSFATPVSTAIQNARLFADAERQWSATYATAQTISEPLIILDESGNVIIANERANDIIRDNMSALFDGISRSVGKTAELVIGDRTYLTTSQHSEGVGTIVVMQDISYVKKLEQNRLEFVHTLTHDLKSPLTSIKGWAQLVEKTVTLDDKSGRFVSQIIASADRMVGMINELLQSIREEENIKFQFEPSDLGPIIDRALSEVEGTALNKSIQITVERPQTPLHIMADPDRMYHLTLNLLSNAVKYTPEDGSVLLQVTDHETGIEIRVADNGPGIPEDDLPHIFERYFRSKSTRHISGAGVGLAVVKAIIEGHGGTIDGHNRQDGGAEFVVKLPPNIRLNGRSQ
jgi:signal transduction histidine kinase